MGMALSLSTYTKRESNSRVPEKVRAHLQSLGEEAEAMVKKELSALFPPKLGDSSSKVEAEAYMEVEERFYAFMKAGPCKEKFTLVKDCVDEDETYTKSTYARCKKHLPVLKQCMDVHSDYYHHILAVVKSVEEHVIKEASDLFDREEREKQAKTRI